MSQIFMIAANFTPLERPQRSAKYRRFIAAMPCAVCRSRKGVEAAHTGSHGIAEKSDDRQTIPLCIRHHRLDTFALDKVGPEIFSEMQRIEIPKLIEKFNRLFDEQIRKRKEARRV
jgi:hypothetical protein